MKCTGSWNGLGPHVQVASTEGPVANSPLCSTPFTKRINLRGGGWKRKIFINERDVDRLFNCQEETHPVSDAEGQKKAEESQEKSESAAIRDG